MPYQIKTEKKKINLEKNPGKNPNEIRKENKFRMIKYLKNKSGKNYFEKNKKNTEKNQDKKSGENPEKFKSGLKYSE